MFYDFDIVDIINKQLPTRKKGVILLDWLYALIKPLKTSQLDFITYKDATIKELSYNSQTMMLEKLLNDEADNTLRRIYIDTIFENKESQHLFNLGEDTGLFIYNKSENQDKTYLYSRSELILDFDFTIYVPLGLEDSEPRIRALADKYKLAGIRYKIIYY